VNTQATRTKVRLLHAWLDEVREETRKKQKPNIALDAEVKQIACPSTLILNSQTGAVPRFSSRDGE